jgi:hypothetical protein
MAGMKTMETPKPTITLPANAISMFGAKPNKTLPAEAMSRKNVTVFLGPIESERSASDKIKKISHLKRNTDFVLSLFIFYISLKQASVLLE